jgi:hypothetical protein
MKIFILVIINYFLLMLKGDRGKVIGAIRVTRVVEVEVELETPVIL